MRPHCPRAVSSISQFASAVITSALPLFTRSPSFHVDINIDRGRYPSVPLSNNSITAVFILATTISRAPDDTEGHSPTGFPIGTWTRVEFPDLFDGHPDTYVEKVTWAGRAASKRCLAAINTRDLTHFDSFDFALAVYDKAWHAYICVMARLDRMYMSFPSLSKWLVYTDGIIRICLRSGVDRLKEVFPDDDKLDKIISWRHTTYFVRNAFNNHYEPGDDAMELGRRPPANTFMESSLDGYIPSREDMPLRPFTLVDPDVVDDDGNMKDGSGTPDDTVIWLDWQWKRHPPPPNGEWAPVYDKRDVEARKKQQQIDDDKRDVAVPRKLDLTTP